MASIDISGASVALADISGVVITPPLPSILGHAVADLSGAVHSGADLLRYAPSLAAAAQSAGGTGSEKLALVQRAAHTAVDLYVPDDERSAAHGLVDGVLPSVIRAILDVSRGRVTIQAAAVAAVVEVVSSPAAREAVVDMVSSPAVQAAAVGLLSRCLGCLLTPRPQAAAPAPQQEQQETPKASI